MRTRNAFTLIELLIVVAIIAILAAIAVPNFLEAQVRAKVSRCSADMRAIATAIEAYAVDYNMPPLILPVPFGPWDVRPYRAFDYNLFGGTGSSAWACTPLTTPVAYMSALPGADPFCKGASLEGSYGTSGNIGFQYMNAIAAYKAKLSGLSMGADQPIAPTLVAPAPFKMVGRGDTVRHISWLLASYGPDKNNTIFTETGVAQTLFKGFADYKYEPCFINGDKVPYDPTNGTMSMGNIYRLSD